MHPDNHPSASLRDYPRFFQKLFLVLRRSQQSLVCPMRFKTKLPCQNSGLDRAFLVVTNMIIFMLHVQYSSEKNFESLTSVSLNFATRFDNFSFASYPLYLIRLVSDEMGMLSDFDTIQFFSAFFVTSANCCSEILGTLPLMDK